MEHMFTRLDWLVGKENRESLNNKSVAVFGCGGVGSFTLEVLVRSGVGRIVIIDGDEFTLSNLNRQLLAMTTTIGERKANVAKERALSIRPDMVVEARDLVYTEGRYPDFMESLEVDYVVDAIDMVSAKLSIIESCQKLEIPCISSMGTGNKLHPELLQITDISKTHTCPLAKVVRRELRKRGIVHQPVIFSTEKPLIPQRGVDDSKSPGSCGFVPSVAGITMAGYVVRNLLGIE